MRVAMIPVSLVCSAVFIFAPGSAQSKRPDQVAKQSQTDHKPPDKSTRSTNQASEENQNQGRPVTPNSEEHPGVASLPPVAVKADKDGWDKRLVLFTGLIVIGGGFQIYFLWGTVKATQNNATAAKEGAEAALLNAEFLVHTERPWVMLLPLAAIPLLQRTQNEPDWIPQITVQFQNFGRTPAWIVEFACKFVLVEKNAPLDFGDSNVWDDGEPVSPGEKSMAFTRSYCTTLRKTIMKQAM